jgi:hypothetical protein
MMRAYPSEARALVKSTRAPRAYTAERPRKWKLHRFLLMLTLLVFPVSNLTAQLFRHRAKVKASAVRPEVRIPVDALGYTVPGVMPAFDFHALVGLHYIDASHLLFTFDLKGLLPRDNRCSGANTQRMVRAVVLDLPSGKVEKQADWELYDLEDYLWSLGNGQFMLRSCSRLEVFGASLDPRPLIEPSGAIEAIGFSPDHSVAVVEQARQETSRPQNPMRPSEQTPAGKVDVEFIRLHPLGVIARARLAVPGIVPIVDTGILEVLTAPRGRWVVNIQPFQGADREIVTLDSFCRPTLTPVTNETIIATSCSAPGDIVLQGFDLNGSSLWRFPLGSDRHDARILLTENGEHFAIESLHIKQPLAQFDQISRDLIDSQAIDIYDTRTGTRIGGFRTTPVYTAGTNASFSPDGTRLAVLHDGAIEIYPLSELAKDR